PCTLFSSHLFAPASRSLIPMLRSRPCYCILCGVIVALVAYLFLGAPQIPSAQPKAVSFINDVAPILKENCFACHDAKKRSGKYDMTTFEKLMAGGAGGEGITSGKHADSELFTLITSEKERRMPPRKDNLSPVPKAQ